MSSLQLTGRHLPCCLFSAMQIVDTRKLISITALRKVTILLSFIHCCATFSTNTETCCERIFFIAGNFAGDFLLAFLLSRFLQSALWSQPLYGIFLKTLLVVLLRPSMFCFGSHLKIGSSNSFVSKLRHIFEFIFR
jgi:hypothetical protein